MLVLLFGTRPEAIKLGPVAAALRHNGVRFVTICTGQHTDLLRGTPAETDLADAISLGFASETEPTTWVKAVLPILEHELDYAEATLVVVQGDTASALAGARAALMQELAIAHVEAGVRSDSLDEPWPEEGFRREITRLASWHYAPTTATYANLLAEGVNVAHVRLTGNPVVSALHRYTDIRSRPPEAFVMLTMHRREWYERVNLLNWLSELREACLDHPRLDVLWPVHPAVAKRLPKPDEWQKPANLWLDPPLPYADMIDLLARSCGVATDSGGLVEEAATLGVPCAILRTHNDRPEAVEEGIARQFAPMDVRAAINTLASGGLPRRATTIYGTADAAAQIAKHLASLVGDG